MSREALYRLLDDTLADVQQRLGGLPSPAEARAIWDELWIHDAHNSTAIEGNTLVLREVEELLRGGRAVGDKRLKEYLEVRGYAGAAQWVYSQALAPELGGDGELVTLTEVRHVHRMAMTPVWDVAPHPDAGPDEGPGDFRKHEIHPFPGGMVPPSRALIDPKMRDWLDAVELIRTESGRHPMESVAAIHVAFEQIHPFIDGNGRTGRLLLNLVLCRLGYAPAIIQKCEREKYLRALRSADRGNFGPLGEQIARAVLDNVLRFVVPALAGPARLVPLPSLATPELNAVALRAAAQRGRLKAQRAENGQWMSCRAWVDEYVASKYQRVSGMAERAVVLPVVGAALHAVVLFPMEGTMGKLIYAANISLDGFLEDESGSIDWSVPDEAVHAFWNEHESQIGTSLYGRRMYETMRVWESDDWLTDEPAVVREYADIWRDTDKIVYSSSLTDVSTARTTIERTFDPEAVRRLKETSGSDLSIGGAGIAAEAFRHGLVDECVLLLCPVTVGGGKPALPRGVRLDLELLDQGRFDNGVIYVRHAVRNSA